jgi:hypothetical protein
MFASAEKRAEAARVAQAEARHHIEMRRTLVSGRKPGAKRETTGGNTRHDPNDVRRRPRRKGLAWEKKVGGNQRELHVSIPTTSLKRLRYATSVRVKERGWTSLALSRPRREVMTGWPTGEETVDPSMALAKGPPSPAAVPLLLPRLSPLWQRPQYY